MEIEREPQRPTPTPPTKPYQAKSTTTTLPPLQKNYSQEVSVIMGLSLVLIGLVGFVMDNLFGAHLSYTHNVIHVLTGALAMWFGFSSLATARRSNLIWGIFYGALGILGFIAGVAGTPSVGAIHEDRFLWRISPESLELGTVDHSMHIIFAAIFILGAALNFKKAQKI